MKKLIAGIVVLIALVVLGSLLWWQGRDPAASPQASASSSRAGSGKLGAHELLPTVTIKDAPWLTQRGVAGRRIAGHVTLDSKPVAAAIVRLAEDLGKTPAQANDFPGFVSNRILMPFINEAAYALLEGVAEPEAIDTIAKLGFAHPMGPLALADLIGLDTCVAIMEVLHEGLGDPKYAPCPLLRRYVAAGRLGRKSGRGFYEYA